METAAITQLCTSRQLHTRRISWVTNWPSPWSWALLEKLPVAQQLENFSTFYGTSGFITVFARYRHWSLSEARSLQSIPPRSISLRFILLLSSYLCIGLLSGLHPSGISSIILYPSFPMRVTCPDHLLISWVNEINLSSVKPLVGPHAPSLLVKVWMDLNEETWPGADRQRCVRISLNRIMDSLGLRFRMSPLDLCEFRWAYQLPKKC
jgi:hypothetical protein